MAGPTLFVGVGSPHGDDRAGWLVADALSEIFTAGTSQPAARSVAGDSAAIHPLPHITIRKTGVPADILDWIDGVAKLIVCDACTGAGMPGFISRWRWPDRRIAQSRSAGTHDFALPTVLELAANLGRLPAETIVWGIEAAVTGGAIVNGAMSPEVQAMLPVLVQEIAGELGRW